MRFMTTAVLLAATVPAAAAFAQDFDACTVFTAADAEQALGTSAAGEPQNPKVKRPKVVTACTYTGTKEGKSVAASAQFRFGRTDADVKQAFDEARLALQTKPLFISGNEAFWSARSGELHVRKGRTWITLAVGPAKPEEREADPARKLAEILAKRI